MVTHKKQWEFLKGKFEASQLSHAYLFSGQEGIGKKTFAKEFIKLVHGKVIEGSDPSIDRESFPDLMVVKSGNSDSSLKNEKDMMEIDVGQIRQVNHFLSHTSYYGGYKSVIIENAERLNQEAQHSFLKTLEEPKGKTLIMLVSSKPDRLLPTILSRCQVVTFFPVGANLATREEQNKLQELLGIISGELAVKFQYTKKVNLEGDNANKILNVLQRYFRNMLLAKIGVMLMPISPQFSNYSIEKLKKIIRLIEVLQKQLSTTNANPKLALEILLIEIAPQSI